MANQYWRETSYQDRDGRWWQVLVPTESSEAEAHLGIPIGPPPLDGLALPEPYATRLHNELFHRRIFSAKQARRHASDISSAIRQVFAIDVQEIIAQYDAATGEEAS